MAANDRADARRRKPFDRRRPATTRDPQDPYAATTELDLKTHNRAAQAGHSERRKQTTRRVRGSPMLDVIFIVSGIAFFILASAYAEGCDRL